MCVRGFKSSSWCIAVQRQGRSVCCLKKERLVVEWVKRENTKDREVVVWCCRRGRLQKEDYEPISVQYFSEMNNRTATTLCFELHCPRVYVRRASRSCMHVYL